VDPSGSYFAWKASAIGKNMANAKTFLEKRYSEEVSPHGPESSWESITVGKAFTVVVGKALQ
jgi:20S proteasome alpha/beta subunit